MCTPAREQRVVHNGQRRGGVVVNNVLLYYLDWRNRTLGHVWHLGRVVVNGRIDGNEMVGIVRSWQDWML